MPKIYGTITKATAQDDGTVIVEGYASSEAVDSQGEIITAAAMKAALPDYMKFANVREMHQMKAAGNCLEANVQDDGRTYIKAHVVDGEAVKKVNAGVYKGFSIGGSVTSRDDMKKTTITGINLSEISLVDRPANPEAIFSFGKADDSQTQTGDKKDEQAGANGGEVNSEKPKEEIAPKESETPPALEAKPDSAPKAAAATAEVKKSMWDVCDLASLVAMLNSIKNSAKWEAEYEGDASTVPAQLTAAVKNLSEILVTMAAEESAELTDGDEGDAVIIELSEKIGNLAKAGARHNKTDKQHVQQIYDSAVALGADSGAAKGVETDDLKKAELEKVAALTTENETLKKRVTELEAQPAPTKIAKAVIAGKEIDSNIAVAKVQDEPKDTLSLIKKAHQEPKLIKV